MHRRHGRWLGSRCPPREDGYAMTDPTIWPIEDHTKAKHALLRRYLGGWFPILTARGYNRRVVYLDGFAGPGIYSNGEPGSPLIAIETLVNHTLFDQLKRTEFLFLLVEGRKDRAAQLEKEIDNFWSARHGGKPPNVTTTVYADQFVKVAEGVLEALDESTKKLAPTFAFIDPFGWSGVPLDLISRLLAFDRCEVLFNFMYDSINRFVADQRPNIAKHFADLFGTDEAVHRRAHELQGDQRKEFLRDLYASQLREVAGFTYVRSFELVNAERGRTAYYLMYGTRHPKGLEKMKEAMWSLDPVAGQRFSGTTGGQPVLFQAEPDFGPLRKAIVERFAGRAVAVDEVERFVIEETDYKRTHYKRVLTQLETDNEISCLTDRTRRLTYPSGTVLRFPSSGSRRRRAMTTTRRRIDG
jgi:three-Cys-motif partner protein